MNSSAHATSKEAIEEEGGDRTVKQIQQDIYSMSRRQALKPCYRKEKTGRTPDLSSFGS